MFWYVQIGGTILLHAAAYGKCDIVTELISLGADVDVQDSVSHFLCLIMTLPGSPNVISIFSVCTVYLLHSLLTWLFSGDKVHIAKDASVVIFERTVSMKTREP